VTERVRVSGACLLGGLSRLIRICGMGRGLVVDVAITSGVNDRLPQRSSLPTNSATARTVAAAVRAASRVVVEMTASSCTLATGSETDGRRHPNGRHHPWPWVWRMMLCGLVAATLATGAEVAAMKVRRLGRTGLRSW
jgi:hypothetical protein